MDTDNADTATEADYRRRWIYERKLKIEGFLYSIFWKFLWSIRLARPYSRLACRLNIYAKWNGGRCQWCGEVHGIHWKIKESAYYRGLISLKKLNKKLKDSSL